MGRRRENGRKKKRKVAEEGGKTKTQYFIWFPQIFQKRWLLPKDVDIKGKGKGKVKVR